MRRGRGGRARFFGMMRGTQKVSVQTVTLPIAEGDVTNLVTDLAACEKTANKGANSGYCGLDSGGLVDPDDLGTGTPSSTQYLRGDQTWDYGPKATLIVTFCGGDWTPTATGVDIVQVILPHLANGGSGRSVTWRFRRLTFRNRTAGSTASAVNVQKSTSSGAFSGSDIMSSDLSLGASTHESSATSFSTATAASGDKLSLAVRGIGTDTAGWIVQLMLEED